MVSITDLITNLPEVVEFNDFGIMKEKILTISPQMFDRKLNETQNLINKIQSLVDILIKECPKSPVSVEDNDTFMKSFKLKILQFKVHINEFRKHYSQLSCDFAFYMESELLLNQEKLINSNCQSESQSQFFYYTKPSESYPWHFKQDLDNVLCGLQSFQRNEGDLINGINTLRRMENISEIKVVTNKFGYLTINN